MVLFEKVCKFFLFLFGEMVGNTYFRSEFIKVGDVQRQFAVLVSCFSYFFVHTARSFDITLVRISHQNIIGLFHNPKYRPIKTRT